jgi:hypothetical protein
MPKFINYGESKCGFFKLKLYICKSKINIL